MRFSEEVLLLREEMRRTLVSLKWYEDWWEKQGPRRTGVQVAVAEGLTAYAQKQAYYRRALHDKFNNAWRHSAELCALGVGADNEILDWDIAVNYTLAAASEFDEVPPVSSVPPDAEIPLPFTLDDIPIPRRAHDLDNEIA
jgi:hypothetical protein